MRLRAWLARLADVRFCRIAGPAFSYTYTLACISLHDGGDRQFSLPLHIGARLPIRSGVRSRCQCGSPDPDRPV
jgi:hypothetical protein